MTHSALSKNNRCRMPMWPAPAEQGSETPPNSPNLQTPAIMQTRFVMKACMTNNMMNAILRVSQGQLHEHEKHQLNSTSSLVPNRRRHYSQNPIPTPHTNNTNNHHNSSNNMSSASSNTNINNDNTSVTAIINKK